MKKKFLISLGAVIATLAPLFAMAQATALISVSPNIPGAVNLSKGPCAWIVNFYYFAMLLAGILAFGAIVYGAYKSATSAGNSEKAQHAREYIWSALTGILLLAGAYVILNTINPSLTKCTLPNLSAIQAPTGPAQPVNPGKPGGGTTTGNCASGQCQQLTNCTTKAGVNGGTTGAGAINCGAAQGMLDTMKCIQGKDPNLQYNVTEGYPPAVAHASAGHNNGCSIDVQVQGGNTCSAISQLQAAAAACGTNALNEYKSCNGNTYKTTTGNNVHINSIKGDGGC